MFINSGFKCKFFREEEQENAMTYRYRFYFDEEIKEENKYAVQHLIGRVLMVAHISERNNFLQHFFEYRVAENVKGGPNTAFDVRIVVPYPPKMEEDF